MKQVNLRLDDELYARVEEARGQVPRERWLRQAVEQVLDAPAMRLRPASDPRRRLSQTSAQAKRGVKPITKGE